ncbi:hypothetical protein B0I37DRAFT_58782 [Chaetomium sp. MPI-CAGE-AT-0009]|nr:hypothetical protein B0I37DRAFT_58782 [Chaetomium sp. MPI-CAGE-AT-0009]
MSLANDVSSLGNLEPTNDRLLCGQYKVASGSSEKSVEASEGKIVHLDWFHCEPLSDGLVERISSIQLVTESHDQGRASDPSSGNWTWFEVCVRGVTRTSEEKVYERFWMSHENAFLTRENAWREGRVFGPGHRLLEFLKRSPLKNKQVRVRACACFRGWRVVAKQGFLVFNIGCETFTQALPLASATYRPITVAGPKIKAPTDALLKGGPGERVSYQTVGDGTLLPVLQKQVNEGQFEILIYEAADLEEALAIQVLAVQERAFGRLLVVIDAGCLLENYEDHGHFSWDTTLEKLSGLKMGQKFGNLHLLVRLGNEGAVYKPPRRQGQDSRQVLIFDTQNPQGYFLKRYLRQGFDRETLEGNLQAAYFAGLAASLAKESSASLACLCETQVKEAVTIALRWSRRYAAQVAQQGKPAPCPATWQGMKLEVDGDPVLVPIRLPGEMTTGSGSLVFRAMPYSPIKHAAWDIVRKGRDAVLSLVPTARFKALATADRNEVERFRRIAHEIERYLGKGENTKPLSIAVFGQPGSGKSFGIEQVILSIMEQYGKGDKMNTLKFDLSQFQQASDLQTAFETIRDQSMRGKMPVVFFDEFDTTFNHEPLHWLRHLLGPIEHGIWKTRSEAERQLGPGIYVFIGGTAKTRDEFRGSSGIAQVDGDDGDDDTPDTPEESSAPGGGSQVEINVEEVIHEADKTLKEPSTTGSGSQAEEHTEQGDDDDEETPEESVPQDCRELEDFLYSQLEEAGREPLYFKISPEKRYTDLVEFFYEIREQTLSGKPPVVFIEGFDADLSTPNSDNKPQTERLGWLKYFLAPMQDGAFIDGGHSRPLGRAIFVFIGGESGHIKGFLDRQDGQEDVVPDDDKKDDEQDDEKDDGHTRQDAANVFRRAKGPDFMSRLLGYVTPSMSLDCLETVVERYKKGGKAKPLSLGFFRDPSAGLPALGDQAPQNGGEQDSRRTTFATLIGDRFVDILGPNMVDEEDEMFVLRRAILLWSILDRLPKEQKIHINDKLLNALLGIPRFHHGARSLEAILSMSKLTSGSEPYKDGDLDGDEKLQLKLHVDWSTFEKLLTAEPDVFGNGEDDPQIKRRKAEIEWHKARVSGERNGSGEGSFQ